jgi:hypothetical protein
LKIKISSLALIEVEILFIPIFFGIKRLKHPEASGAGRGVNEKYKSK